MQSVTRAGLKSLNDWYFEKNGERGGPVGADEIKAMLASGAVNLTSLIWTAAFGSEWKRLGETELAPPKPVGPPPLPSREPPALPPKPAPPTAVADGFLDSELTKALISQKQDHYLAKWRTLLAKAGGDPVKVAQTTSWNWPALFIPYGWLLFRKMYALGGILLALHLVYVLLPESVPSAVSRALSFATIGMGVVVAMYGNAWYFAAIRKRWDALRQEPDQAAALAQAKQAGGVSWAAPIVAFALVIAAAVGPYLVRWDSGEALVRDGYMSGYASTTIGKALAASFDDANWRVFTTDKGAKVIEFTGKINASLHANAVDRLMAPVRETAADADLNIRYGSFEGLMPLLETALAHLKARDRLQPLWDKHGCEDSPGKPPTCDMVAVQFTRIREVVAAWADDAYWSVGEPVSIQWTVNPDGRSFSLASMNSNAWKGKPFSDLFAVIYD